MTEKAAENPTGNPAGKAIDFQALITEAEKMVIRYRTTSKKAIC